jgi:hypothetical protein
MISRSAHFQGGIVKTKFFNYSDTFPNKLSFASGGAFHISEVVIAEECEANAFFFKFGCKETFD